MSPSTVLAWIFGVINVIQFVHYLLEKNKRTLHEANLRAALLSLQAVRGKCTDAIALEEVLTTPPSKDFARSIAFMVLPIENIIKAMLPVPKQSTSQMSELGP